MVNPANPLLVRLCCAPHFSSGTIINTTTAHPLSPLSPPTILSRNPPILNWQWVVTTKVDPRHGSCAVRSPSQERPEKSSSSRAGSVQTTGFVSRTHSYPACRSSSDLLLTVTPLFGLWFDSWLPLRPIILLQPLAGGSSTVPKGGWEQSDGVLEAAASREALEEGLLLCPLPRLPTS